MLRKNQIIELNIDDLTAEGSGVGRFEGMAVFVPDVLPGEKVQVRVEKVASSYAAGKKVALLEASPERAEAACPHFARCGGCTLMHMNYEAQLKAKENIVRETLRRIGGVEPEVLPIFGAEHPLRYRNKAQFPVGAGGIGLFAARSHTIVPVDDCLLQHESCAGVIAAVRRYMQEANVPAYDEKTHKGVLRHLMVRQNRKGEMMVVPVTCGKKLPASERLIALLRDIPGVVSIIQNINSERTNVILGKTCVHLWGQPQLEETLCGLSFRISPHSFFQVNPEQTEKLYAAAREFAQLSGTEHVYDLYCGTGTIGLSMAHMARKVTGVEIVPSAVRDAEENARRNGITNAAFHLGAAEELLPGLLKNGEKPDVVLLDPPRKGCAPELLEAVAGVEPVRIVYVSCSPATLARDVKLLSALGYTAEAARPVDMFPQTGHVETVCLLSKLNTK